MVNRVRTELDLNLQVIEGLLARVQGCRVSRRARLGNARIRRPSREFCACVHVTARLGSLRIDAFLFLSTRSLVPHLVHCIALNARPSPSFPPNRSHTQCSQAALPLAPHLSRPKTNRRAMRDHSVKLIGSKTVFHSVRRRAACRRPYHIEKFVYHSLFLLTFSCVEYLS